ncbi:glycosyltransferase [Limnoglobus roseus]|uniref:GT2 family glycosyltransferase n=1 Tax=Limnoglobus roseus TaxID=2598579 RepID=A0A5C1ABL6_9BACT|nr:glycosyltransferase [Limnoglobus roseus]QEL15563.1 GT2 family glycosyltransferase [Limnoglobus roseus]
MIDLTVAVCTYRRGELLRTTLDSLAVADPPGCRWELLLIDNEGSPRVPELVVAFSNRLPIRYVVEPVTGNAHARNRAVTEARGPVLLFTDDDAVAHPGWLREMAAAVRDHAECDFWGGAIRPDWGTLPRPDWFDEQSCPMLRDAIVQYDAGPESRPWVAGRDLPFYTCNLALRVAAVRAAGLFDPTLGYFGTVRIGGEDVRLVETLQRRGGKGWYVATAVVDHPVPVERLTPAYALSFARRQGFLSYELLARDHGGRVPRWAYKAAAIQWAGGWSRWTAGLIQGNPKKRFAGRMTAAFARSKLKRAFNRPTLPNSSP